MSAKNIIIKPISKPQADVIVKKYHYSGKVVQNSCLCFGVYYKGLLLGAMQFGPPTVKSKLLPLVPCTKWNEMLELNRMAFSDALPRFGESRAISQSFKWLKKNAPHVKWIVSFSDGCQCGHGTIYQASNFKLTQIKENKSMVLFPSGRISHMISLRPDLNPEMRADGYTSPKKWLDEKHVGWRPLRGYMLRYIYFIDKSCEENYLGEFIPFSKIKEMDAQMYKGKSLK